MKKMKITLGMYRAISTICLPLAGLYLMWRSRRQKEYRYYWDERFAWTTYPLRTTRPRVWVHAVSVGETNATRPLLKAMLEKWPDCDILLTHMTPTGRKAGEKIVQMAPERIRQCYLPYDAPYAVEKFFRQTRPTMGVIMETEVWPNIMLCAKRNGIPVVLANARESEKSLAKANKFIELMRPAFSAFAAVLAQSEEDKERIESLGSTNVSVCGSLKFDIPPHKSQAAAAKSWKMKIEKQVVLAASTRDGEEKMLFDEILKNKAVLKDNLFLVVPRHPQRFDEVFTLASDLGLQTARRSEFTDPSQIPSEVEVLIGDTMGEMSFYCALADVTLMGGSFGEYGCQNVIEPAMAGSPVVCGPSTYNFEKIVSDGAAAGCIIRCSGMEDGLRIALEVLYDQDKRRLMSLAAQSFSREWSGATKRMMNILEEIWQSAQKESRMS